MASLPHDIIRDVLCRLAVKDLLRFRCVSKTFCSRSLKTNSNRALIFCSVERNNYFSVNVDSLKTVHKLNNPLDVSDEGKYTEMLGSCNGLLALFNREGQISLWNPSTGKSQMLPLNKIEFPPGCSRCRALVFGFGYNSVAGDYKLVRIIQLDSFESEVMVYSLRTDSWRRIKDFPFYLKHESYAGVLANNALHWVVSKTPESESQGFVVALDLETEEYHAVELPNGVGDPFYMIVKAMGGCLCLSANYWEESAYWEEAYVIDVWIMKEYGVKESWTKLISLKKSLSIPDCRGMILLPLGFSKNGEKLLLSFDENKLIWYDMRSKRINKVRIRGAPSRFEVQMLVESLVPLNRNGASATVNKKKQISEKRRGKR